MSSGRSWPPLHPDRTSASSSAENKINLRSGFVLNAATLRPSNSGRAPHVGHLHEEENLINTLLDTVDPRGWRVQTRSISRAPQA